MGQNIDRTKAKAEEVTEIARESVLLAISNSQRMRVLGLLRVKGPMTVGMISDVTGMAPGSVSFHLKNFSMPVWQRRQILQMVINEKAGGKPIIVLCVLLLVMMGV